MLYIRQMLSASSDHGLPLKGIASLTEFNYSNSKVSAALLTAIAGKKLFRKRRGFLEREDFVHNQPSLYLFFRPKGLPAAVSFYNPLITADIYHQTSTLSLQEVSAVISPPGFFSRGQAANIVSTCCTRMKTSARHLALSTAISIPPDKYRWLRWELYGRTNQAAPLQPGDKGQHRSFL